MKLQRSNGRRGLRFEPLESRQVLSASLPTVDSTGFVEPVDSTMAVFDTAIDEGLAARDARLAISAIHLRVGDRSITINSLDQLIKMEVGDRLAVVGIDYRLAEGVEVSGKVAFEGYLNKLKGSKLRTDYSDGRFGRHEQDGQLPTGESSHGGLDGEWTMKAGTESVTLVLVRYDESGATVEDRVTLKTQVGTPDFVMSSRAIATSRGGQLVVGETARIYGLWANVGEGTYRNYAEVDVYHESDPSTIVWAGTLSRTLGGNQAVIGEFHNSASDEQFSKRWTPNQAGNYVLKFYADPEQSWDEVSEENNVTTIKVTVKEHSRWSDFARKHRTVEAPPMPVPQVLDAARTLVSGSVTHDEVTAADSTTPPQGAVADDLRLSSTPSSSERQDPQRATSPPRDSESASAEGLDLALAEWSGTAALAW